MEQPAAFFVVVGTVYSYSPASRLLVTVLQSRIEYSAVPWQMASVTVTSVGYLAVKRSTLMVLQPNSFCTSCDRMVSLVISCHSAVLPSWGYQV